METASLFIQKLGVILSGTMSHMIVSDAIKASRSKGIGARILFNGKSTQSTLEMC